MKAASCPSRGGFGQVRLAFAKTKGAEGTGLGGSGETILIAEIALLLFVGRGLGELMQRIGQPAVIGQLLAGRWKDVEPRMNPGTVRDYKGPTRSPDASMNCAKVQKLLSFPLPRFTEWLRANPNEAI